jgi:hypothetical protein
MLRNMGKKPGRCPSTQTNASLSTSQRSAKQLIREVVYK